MSKPTVIITGASGLIGTALVNHFAAKGWHVRALVRNPAKQARQKNVQYTAYDLTRAPNVSVFKGADYLIHAAYIASRPDQPKSLQQNIDGAARIIAASRQHKLKKNIFISSLSSRPDALSSYGKQKYEIEKLFSSKQDNIIRPGLVIGTGGLVQETVHFMRRFHAIPLIDGGRQPVQVIGIHDLVKGIEAVLEEPRGVFTIAHPQKMTYRQFYKMLAKAMGLRVAYVPTPFAVMRLLIRSAHALGVPLGVTEDNLLGLKKLAYFDTTANLAALKLQPDSLETILRRLTFGSQTPRRPNYRLRYLISGGISFGVELLCFSLLLQLTNHLLFANSVSFAIGVAVGFSLHKLWSFAGDHQLRTPQQLAVYFTLAAFNLLLTNILIALLVTEFGLWPWLAKAIVIATIVVWNYMLYKLFIFRIKTRL